MIIIISPLRNSVQKRYWEHWLQLNESHNYMLYSVLLAITLSRQKKIVTYLFADSCSKSSIAWRKTVTNKTYICAGNINPLGEFSWTFIFILSHNKIPTLKFIIVKLLLHEHFFEATTNLSVDAPDSKFCEFEISHIIVITAWK